MQTKPADPATIDTYIAAFPPDIRSRLTGIRRAIRKAAPQAEETIKYRMPTFVLNGNLVHFAGYDRHVGFYPTPSAIAAFKKELDAYENAKGSVQFPHDRPIPLSLVEKITRFRVRENLAKAAKKPKATSKIR
jgi:uncharacterized protein YdhG (YjbR/CyaY superfamily)